MEKELGLLTGNFIIKFRFFKLNWASYNQQKNSGNGDIPEEFNV